MGRTVSREHPGDGLPDSDVDCRERTEYCRAVCCSFRFALTEEEAGEGAISYDKDHPCFIAQDPDGYCTHHDRLNRTCTIWETRPLRCRRYNCLTESRIWKDSGFRDVQPGTFDHLPPLKKKP